jgi:hypoxanthine phosphoribosyltransferase
MISQLSSSGVPIVEEEAGRTNLEYSSLSLEWRESRLSIDRFDKITVDLRKYGFSFVAIIISSSSIIFDATKVQNPLPLVIVPIVVALLTLSLFLADSYYQVLLLATILHARHLENIHKEILSRDSIGQTYFGFNITNYIEDKVQKTNAHFYTVIVYVLFLVISSLMGYFALWAYEINLHIYNLAPYFWMLTAGFATILLLLVIVSRGVSKLLREMRQTEMVDNRFVIQKLFEKKDVDKATKELAEKIYRTYKTTHFKVLTLGMGGLYFANSLISALKWRRMTNIELISAFSERKGDDVSIESPQPSDIDGENILIVDDLVSTGITLVKAIEMCHSLGAKTIRTCVLIDAYKKRRPAAAGLRVDFSGLKTSESKRFFVGSGLDGGQGMSSDAADKVRLLPYIGVLVAPQGDNDK